MQIHTATLGNRASAKWGGVYVEGRNRAEALSLILAKIAKQHPERVGENWTAPECDMRGTIPKPKRGRK